MYLVFALQSGSAPTGITKSTVIREPLPKGSVTETDYFADNLGWVENQTTLLSGMKEFYVETGVQPYLYLTDNIDGIDYPTEDEMDQFANSLYDKLFSDEAHILLVFMEYDSQYYTWYVCGVQAKTVLDAEATDILLDYIDRYYYYNDLSEDEMFSKSFGDAAKGIMQVEPSPLEAMGKALQLTAVLAIIIILYQWWSRAKKQKNLEAEKTLEILNTPLEEFGSTEVDELTKKYD